MVKFNPKTLGITNDQRALADLKAGFSCTVTDTRQRVDRFVLSPTPPRIKYVAATAAAGALITFAGAARGEKCRAPLNFANLAAVRDGP